MNVARIAAKTLFAAADLALPRIQGPRILIYHQVGSGRTHEMNIELPVFCRQIKWMQNNGEIVSLEEAVKRRGETNADRLFVITFDDGYSDVFTNAFPVLCELKLPFTLYLTSGPIENRGAFPDWPGNPLTWDQVRSMISSGLVTVGAHTHTHPDLRQMTEGAAIEELDRSNSLIAERTGIEPDHFTYPKGRWAAHVHDHVAANYLSATLGGGNSITEQSNLHMLNRIPLQRNDIGRLFNRKVRRGGRIEERFRRLLRGYKGP